MVEAKPPLDHDRYHPKPEAITGWIECGLETCSPTYVRGMLTETQFAQFGQAKPDQLKDEQKKEMATFFGVEENVPLLPGSSLRGMIRQIMEIVGHSRMRYVSPAPTFTFRAVADQSNDPSKRAYSKELGPNARNVKAGYLKYENDKWFVIPATTQKDVRWSTKSTSQYIKIYDEDISDEDLPGFLKIGDSHYVPQIHAISFKYGERKDKTNWNGKGSPTRPSIIVGKPEAKLGFLGTLVCAGDMLETTRSKFATSQNNKQDTPRNKHIIVLPLILNEKKKLMIPEQVVEDYRAGLTDFQNEKLDAWGGQGWGCLKDGAPVFYVQEDNVVRYFGHSINFRIPARLNVSGETRAANPRDFVPAYLRENSKPDLVDGIFGWVEDTSDPGIGLKGQRAGRVFFSDAHCLPGQDNVWYKQDPIVPHVLSGPKSTTFQHYLVQDGRAGQNGHHPDSKKDLAHYGTPPGETQIRGYKQYWHKGNNPDIEASAAERQHPTQLTQISPVREGVRFRFKVYFENLRPEELGLLWWTLALPGEEGKLYRHKLGMGKPMGMGSIAITPTLFVTDRQARYQTLFGGELWEEAARSVNVQPYIDFMNHYLLQEQGLDARLHDITGLERIQVLLAMLEWREGTSDWLAKTRYMEIEHGQRKVNEYKERPVLPDPFGVLGVKAAPAQPPTTTTTQQPITPHWGSDNRSHKSSEKPTRTQSQSGQREDTNKPLGRSDEQQTKSPTTTAVSPPPPHINRPTAPQIGERIMGKVDTIDKAGDVYLIPEKETYQKWLLRVKHNQTEGIQYQLGQSRACTVLQLLPDDEILECKPGPKKKR
ncbi:MAG: TIGR03986 family CRISPR-associated RAMP protein [Anaerolineales bacterium]|nr:TIGR03986 family CRISPR-associated RAMP protein [Anaerolineales bacterium]